MKKHIHLGFCCLLSGLMFPIAASGDPVVPVATGQAGTVQAGTQDGTDHEGKTGKILASVGQVVSGLVNIIAHPHAKVNILQNVGQMLAGIMNIAANAVQKNVELTEQDIEIMLQTTQEALVKHALAMHEYLRNLSAEELAIVTHRAIEAEDDATQDAAIATSDEDQELQNGILGSLHDMIHELFAIIQNPENPQIIGEKIADILSSIMNVASQAIKYEYMTSKNAEETVALYIKSFSNELTKKITNLMLQTALHIRGSRSCCKTSCCSSKCSTSCCSGCKPCCSVADDTQDSAAYRCCTGFASKCSAPCGSCGSCWTTVSRSGLIDETVRACGCGCSSSCNNCSSCGKCCSNSNRTEVTDEEMSRSCNCGCSSCGKCGCSTTTTSTLVEMTTDATVRACGCSCSSSCNNCSSCGKCCSNSSRTEMTDEEMSRSCNCGCSSCGKCGCSTTTTSGLVEMTADATVRACGCGCSSSCNNCSSCGKCCSNSNLTATTAEETVRACGNCGCSSCGKCGCSTTTTSALAEPSSAPAEMRQVSETVACGCSSKTGASSREAAGALKKMRPGK